MFIFGTDSFQIMYTRHRLLKFISNQCVLDVSIMSGKPEVHPGIFSGKKLLRNINFTDFKFYTSKLTNKNFPHMV